MRVLAPVAATLDRDPFGRLRAFIASLRRRFTADAMSALLPPPLLVIAAILLIQIGAATAKGVMTAENAMGFVLLRNLGAALMLLAVVRPRIVGLTRRQWLDIAGLSVALALFNGVFYLAIPRVPLGLVVTIGFLGPLAVSVFGARRPLDYAWPLLALAGVALLTPWGGSSFDPLGLAFAFAYAGAWVAYVLMSARSGRSIPGFEGLSIALAISTFMLVPFGLHEAGSFLASPVTVATVAMVSLFTVLPFALEYLALKRLNPAVYGVIIATEPAFAALAGLVLLGEVLGLTAWIALVAVSIAAAGSTLTSNVKS